jgi:cardiolipin synthase
MTPPLLPIDLTLTHWLTLHGLVTVAGVLAYVVHAHATRQRRAPTAAIAWILFILLLPYLAVPAFLLFGSRKLARPLSTAIQHRPLPTEPEAWAVDTAAALGQPAPQRYTDLNLHGDGHVARNALVATIEAARDSIDLCTFVLGRDELGAALVERLRDKAAQGVRVRLLLDGMGSLMSRPPDLRRLLDAGGEFARFVPPLRSPQKGRTNLRNHRKLLIADAALGTAHLWCGGRNLAAEYFEGLAGQAPWRDLSFDLRGPVVGQASDLFEHDWAFANAQQIGAARATAARSRASASSTNGAQLIASGPDQADDAVHALLVTAAYRASQRIALATPYFVPESALLMALCLAARRGVAVDLLLPARSNHRLSDLARARSLRSLAQAGGRIWLTPGMMHAKLAVIDDALALAGSANLDSRSLFINYELMMAFHDPADVQRFGAWFETQRATANEYAASAPGWVRDGVEGMMLWLGFQL